jgi:peptidoglycan/LPS O-acetylase OafA/YrhL
LGAGAVPARYPGGVTFVLASLAGTALLYGGLATWSPAGGSMVDAVLRRAGGRSLAVYVAHYGVYVVLHRLGMAGELPGEVGLAAALAGTAAIAVVAAAIPTRRRPARPVGPVDLRPAPIGAAARRS